MSDSADRANWFYWELGLLTSMLATAVTPADTAGHLAYGVVSLLFLWGMIRA